MEQVRHHSFGAHCCQAGRARTSASYSGVRDGDLDLDARLDGDRGDLLHDVGRRVEIDEALVDPHLKLVPSVRALAARRLARVDPELLRGEAHWPSHLELLL